MKNLIKKIVFSKRFLSIVCFVELFGAFFCFNIQPNGMFLKSLGVISLFVSIACVFIMYDLDNNVLISKEDAKDLLQHDNNKNAN